MSALAITFDLVTTENGVPITTSLAIAEGTGNEHASVILLVRKYQADLEGFGLVRFKIAPRPAGQHGGGDIEYAILNERQATLLIAYMKNNEIVRAFKLRLVKRFYEMAEQLKTPKLPLGLASQELNAALDIAKLFGFEGNQALLSANRAVRSLYGVDCMALTGATHLIAPVQEVLLTPTEIAKRAGLSRNAVNPVLQTLGLQRGYRDHKDRQCWELTEVGKRHAEYLDTGKRHSDGSPIRQIKWYASVVKVIQANASVAEGVH